MQRAPTEEEFNAWLADPVTQSVKKLFHTKREELRQAWEGGSFTDYARETVALVNVGNIGTCKGYAFFTDLTYEQYISEIDNGEHVRADALGSSSAD